MTPGKNQKQQPDLFAPCLAGLLYQALVRGQAGYAARSGLLALPLSALALAAAMWLLGRCWRWTEGKLLRALLCALLAYSSALELLRMWRLLCGVYPGAVTLLGVCLVILGPVIYLRRPPALTQTAHVLLALLALACLLLLVCTAPRLDAANLQSNLALPQALRGQLVLAPELLLYVCCGGRKDTVRHGAGAALRLALGFTGADAALHLLLELFFGAALQRRQNPLHAVLRCGALSVFTRLEWLQLLLWCMLLSLRLALYLYAAVELAGGQSGKAADNTVGLDRYPLYFAGLFLLCFALRGVDLAAAGAVQSAAYWLFAALVAVAGGVKWCFKRPKSAC